MNRNVLLNNVFMFATGATIGSLVTWKLVSDKCNQRADEEIESMKQHYAEKYGEVYEQLSFDDIPDEEEDEDPKPSTLDEHKDFVADLGYTNYADMKKETKEVDDLKKPYVIAPEEFTEIPDYETESLIYFSDGVLTNDKYDPIEDVDYMVGIDSLDHFGEYEDDSVFVRNDILKTDFEILLDSRTYYSLINHGAHSSEDE